MVIVTVLAALGGVPASSQVRIVVVELVSAEGDGGGGLHVLATCKPEPAGGRIHP